MSTTWGDGALPEKAADPRASDDDRVRVAARLRTAAGEGLIDLDELEQRLSAAYAARTLPELAPLTADLPDDRPRRTEARVPRSAPSPAFTVPAFRMHFTVYVLTITMLFTIWALSGGGRPVWPLFPAAGWGIGLGAHWQVAELAAARRARRRERQTRSAGASVVRAGAASAAPAVEIAERAPAAAPATRFVVAMFIDIAGSTPLNEALGDERWAAVRRSFRAVVAECTAEHGGWEANCSGDGVLARFTDPGAAASAGEAILRRLEHQRATTGFAPSVRIGIHSGDAVEEGDDIIGNVVNLASRVTDAADLDEILVTEHVADHLDGRHVTEGRGLHTLKGVARPRHLLTLVWR